MPRHLPRRASLSDLVDPKLVIAYNTIAALENRVKNLEAANAALRELCETPPPPPPSRPPKERA